MHFWCAAIIIVVVSRKAGAVVTDADLTAQLGIDVKAMKKNVTWKEWINNRVPTTFPPPCEVGSSGISGCCNVSNDHCNKTLFLSCNANSSSCSCQRGYIRDYEKSVCVEQRARKLGERCTPFDVCPENSGCTSGVCTCFPIYKQSGRVCKPSEFAATCNTKKDECPWNKFLRCNDFTRLSEPFCDCKPGYFFNYASRVCVTKKQKKLGASCNLEKDVCSTAYANCINGTCQCLTGFTNNASVCVPNEYRCPYGAPWRPANASVQICDGSKANSCPKEHFCLTSTEKNRFFTSKGVEQGYCCPFMPNISAARFQEFCYFGEVVNDREPCPPTTHSSEQAISSNSLCCPRACMLQADSSTSLIVDGQCVYKRPEELFKNYAAQQPKKPSSKSR